MCGDLRLCALLVLAAAMSACSLQDVPSPSPSPTSPAMSQAADLRTHLDLLLAEQVMILAKESSAAIDHTDEYVAYTQLLATNSGDLTTLVARAYGNTAGAQFAQLWNTQNADFVDYTIGIVTHNDDRTKAAVDGLNAFTPRFAQLVSSVSHLPLAPITELTSTQVLEDRAFIDDIFGGDLKSFYADVHRAYVQTSRFGDVLAEQISAGFPDKFPGDALAQSVDRRVAINLQLQEHSYLATMATDATVNSRDADRQAALSALSANTDSMGATVEDQRFSLAWSEEDGALLAYATSKTPLRGDLVSVLAGVSRAKPVFVAHHLDASVKVIDDQRLTAKSVADDDRAAASSMQPIADSVF
jgi:hypothetical protein